jgi:hypothetical protein
MREPLADGTVLALAALCVIGGAGLVRKGLYGSAATIEQKTGIKLVGRYSAASLEAGNVDAGGSYAAYIVSAKGGSLWSAGEINGLLRLGADEAHDRIVGYEATDDRGEKSPIAFPTLERAAQWLHDQADAMCVNESWGWQKDGSQAWVFAPADLPDEYVIRFHPEAHCYSVFRIVRSEDRTRLIRAKAEVTDRAIRAVRRGMRKSFRF